MEFPDNLITIERVSTTMIRQIYVFAFLENAMNSQQENKLFVQDGALSERSFLGAIQEIKASIHWVRKYSAELALGVFVITMLYVFGYMMNSNLPLNLSSTPLVLKISVLFSFVLIVVSLLTYVVVCNGIVLRCICLQCGKKGEWI